MNNIPPKPCPMNKLVNKPPSNRPVRAPRHRLFVAGFAAVAFWARGAWVKAFLDRIMPNPLPPPKRPAEASLIAKPNVINIRNEHKKIWRIV